ncbi:hypothetical protein AVEN_115188-1 [Araneus ventricosus]|uniref:Reverse transcriptase domain-containing protein n=1 Tax=Araneus ventricosus TaxID=182803 RepID=A0A4Y1ZXJ8_ARAVE|nr:hypothetical protein AVEN_115188-1 [Araneus ventricosus]
MLAPEEKYNTLAREFREDSLKKEDLKFSPELLYEKNNNKKIFISVPNFTIKLKLSDGAKPSYTPERNVPYALREKVDKELDSLEAAGIISKSSTSVWGSPLVVIPKGDGIVSL